MSLNYPFPEYLSEYLSESIDWDENFTQLAQYYKPNEACGVFGIYATKEDVAKLTYFGLYALQHRGHESAGIATFEREQVCLHKGRGLVFEVFCESILSQLSGSSAIGHIRHSTDSLSQIINAQPIVVETHLGVLALAHDGNLVNTAKLCNELLLQDYNLVNTTDSELIALAVAEEVKTSKNWVEGVIRALRRCQGAFSLVFGTPVGLMGVRDPNGIRSLVIGTIGSSSPNAQPRYVLASETCGLDVINAEYLRDVEPGELVWITKEGIASFQWSKQQKPKHCIFERIYLARPDSLIHDENLYSYRQRLGQRLAKEAPANADLVISVPDSGIPAAIGFSQVSGIPYTEGLVENRYVDRTFIQPTKKMRELDICVKLNPIRDLLAGKRVVLVNGYIVHPTTSRQMVKVLREAGAHEVHMRISSPPTAYPCFYGINIDSQAQLIATAKSAEEIAAQIGVDSLSYLSWKSMLEETREDSDNFCSACFTGNYPIPVP